MTTKSIQVRMDDRLKKRVEKVLAELGIDVPTAVRMFFAQVATTGGIPFSLAGTSEDRYSERSLRMLDALAASAKRDEDLSVPFSSVDALLEDLRK